MPVGWLIAIVFTGIQATMQTRIAMGHNPNDYGWPPFFASDNFKVAGAILDWLLVAICLIGLVVAI